MIQDRLEHFKGTCREAGLRLTPQKLEIFRILASTDAHPSAQEIFEAVQRDFPNISFATVYDNLRKFKDLGLVREIACGGSCSRFDANMEDHHHVLNESTGEIMDVHLTLHQTIPVPKSLEGKSIRDIKITYIV